MCELKLFMLQAEALQPRSLEINQRFLSQFIQFITCHECGKKDIISHIALKITKTNQIWYMLLKILKRNL